MGMYHNQFVLFLCPFNIIFLYLRIFILFLSKMKMQSLSHIWNKEISDAMCNSSKMCAFFAWIIRLLNSRMIPVFVVFIVALFANCTVGPLRVVLMFASTNMSSMHQ